MAEEEEKSGWFKSSIDTFSGIAHDIVSFLWVNCIERLPAIIQTTMNQLNAITMLDADPFLERLLSNYKSYGLLDDEDVIALKNMHFKTFPFNMVSFLFIWYTLFSKRLSISMNAASGTIVQEYNKRHTPNVPSEEKLINTAFIAPEKYPEVKDNLMRLGYNEKDIDLMFIANYQLYDVNTIRQLFLRGELSESLMFERLREHGLTDTRIKELIKIWELIPSVSDLFHLVAKEAFEPTAIKELGLLGEYPEEQTKWLEAQGLSKYWGEKYWIAHWIPPSIGQTFEMLHRGVVDDSFVDAMFKVHEIPPGARAALKAISYNPYTRVDVRRMHKAGVIGDEELLQAYKDVGYDQEHAENMVIFTKAYNQGAEKELTKAQIMKGYVELGMSKADTTTMLMNLGYTEELADYYIALEDSKTMQEEITEEIKLIAERFQGNLITESDARKNLLVLGISGEKTEHYILKWKTFKMIDAKIPSKTDLLKMYKSKVINKDRYYQELKKLGYNHEYATWYVTIA